jgi:exodeoxyribonuclease VII small subunit
MAKKQASYEDKVEELEAILRRLDDAETPIDTLAQDVKKGAALIRELDHKLREVEAQVRDAFEELEAVGASDED